MACFRTVAFIIFWLTSQTFSCHATFQYSDHVVVIGATPAGCHTALLAYESGCKNVTLIRDDVADRLLFPSITKGAAEASLSIDFSPYVINARDVKTIDRAREIGTALDPIYISQEDSEQTGGVNSLLNLSIYKEMAYSLMGLRPIWALKSYYQGSLGEFLSWLNLPTLRAYNQVSMFTKYIGDLRYVPINHGMVLPYSIWSQPFLNYFYKPFFDWQTLYFIPHGGYQGFLENFIRRADYQGVAVINWTRTAMDAKDMALNEPIRCVLTQKNGLKWRVSWGIHTVVADRLVLAGTDLSNVLFKFPETHEANPISDTITLLQQSIKTTKIPVTLHKSANIVQTHGLRFLNGDDPKNIAGPYLTAVRTIQDTPYQLHYPLSLSQQQRRVSLNDFRFTGNLGFMQSVNWENPDELFPVSLSYIQPESLGTLKSIVENIQGKSNLYILNSVLSGGIEESLQNGSAVINQHFIDEEERLLSQIR